MEARSRLGSLAIATGFASSLSSCSGSRERARQRLLRAATTSIASALQTHVAHTNEHLGVPSFVWLGSDVNERFVADPKASPVDVAWGTLRAVKGALKLSDGALAGASVTAVHDLGRGAIITRFDQNDRRRRGLRRRAQRDDAPRSTPVAVTGSLAPSTKRAVDQGWTARRARRRSPPPTRR